MRDTLMERDSRIASLTQANVVSGDGQQLILHQAIVDRHG